MGKLTVSMAIFNSYVELPEGKNQDTSGLNWPKWWFRHLKRVLYHSRRNVPNQQMSASATCRRSTDLVSNWNDKVSDSSVGSMKTRKKITSIVHYSSHLYKSSKKKSHLPTLPLKMAANAAMRNQWLVSGSSACMASKMWLSSTSIGFHGDFSWDFRDLPSGKCWQNYGTSSFFWENSCYYWENSG